MYNKINPSPPKLWLSHMQEQAEHRELIAKEGTYVHHYYMYSSAAVNTDIRLSDCVKTPSILGY